MLDKSVIPAKKKKKAIPRRNISLKVAWTI